MRRLTLLPLATVLLIILQFMIQIHAKDSWPNEEEFEFTENKLNKLTFNEILHGVSQGEYFEPHRFDRAADQKNKEQEKQKLNKKTRDREKFNKKTMDREKRKDMEMNKNQNMKPKGNHSINRKTSKKTHKNSNDIVKKQKPFNVQRDKKAKVLNKKEGNVDKIRSKNIKDTEKSLGDKKEKIILKKTNRSKGTPSSNKQKDNGKPKRKPKVKCKKRKRCEKAKGKCKKNNLIEKKPEGFCSNRIENACRSKPRAQCTCCLKSGKCKNYASKECLKNNGKGKPVNTCKEEEKFGWAFGNECTCCLPCKTRNSCARREGECRLKCKQGEIKRGKCGGNCKCCRKENATTNKPTTNAPTTDKQTTNAPTTNKQTDAPTTTQSTIPPSTVIPTATTNKPTTNAPTTDKQTTNAPTTNKQTDAPTTTQSTIPPSTVIPTVSAHPCDSISGSFNDWINSATMKEVVIVGGGISGLQAANTLLNNQVQDFVLLEAQDYLGGRVKTVRQGSILVEEGAEWINGGIDNPLYNLSEKLEALTQPLNDSLFDFRVKTSEGEDADQGGYDVCKILMEECEQDPVQINYHDVGAGQCYQDGFDRDFDKSPAANSGERDAWLRYLQTWVNKDTGTNTWMDISGRDADHFTDWGNDSWNQWKNGFDTLTKYLLKNLSLSNVEMQSPVCKAYWNSDPEGRVLVVTANQKAYITDFLIMTPSIGHLKERHLTLFDPPLPISYRKLFDGIELGLCDKVQLGWNYQWWRKEGSGKAPLTLQIIFKNMNLPQEESWLTGIMEFLSIHQQENMIQGFVSGDRARQMENLTEKQVKEHVMKHLRKVTDQEIPEPTFFRRSQWMNNPWTRGSYNSYVTVPGDKAGLKSRDPLAVPIQNSKNRNVIFWGGEHTHTSRFGTVDGAQDAGSREAFNVLDEMDLYY